MLAISLHAVRDDLRDMLVPINKKWPLKELLQACRDYPGLSNARRITFEYVMLNDINDSDADARELVRLLAGIPAKINLIPSILARHQLRLLELIPHRALCRHRQQCRLCQPGPHAARPRQSLRLRAAEVRDRAAEEGRSRGACRCLDWKP